MEVGAAAELSLNSVVGFTTPGTIKLKWKIDDQKVIMLVDCGATHNFLAQRLVDKLNIPHFYCKFWGYYGHMTTVKGKEKKCVKM